jgi:hypothetical protein
MIAIAAVLLASTATSAMAAEFDPNLGNRYPAYNEPITHGALQSTAVALHKGGTVTGANQENWYAVDRADRASSPYSGF